MKLLLKRKSLDLKKLKLLPSKTLNIQLLMILYHPGIMGLGHLQNHKRRTYIRNKLLKSYWRKLLQRRKEVMQSRQAALRLSILRRVHLIGLGRSSQLSQTKSTTIRKLLTCLGCEDLD